MYSLAEFLLFSISFAVAPIPVISVLNYWLLVIVNGSCKGINFQKIIGLGLNYSDNYIAAIRRITFYNCVAIGLVIVMLRYETICDHRWIGYLKLGFQVWLLTLLVLSTMVVVGRFSNLSNMNHGHSPYKRHKVALRSWLPMLVLSIFAIYVRSHSTNSTFYINITIILI